MLSALQPACIHRRVPGMKQLDFLTDIGISEYVCTDTFDYRPRLFSHEQSQHYLNTLLNTVPWSQQTSWMYGKEVAAPRLHAWYGDRDRTSNNASERGLAWTPELLEIKTAVVALSGISFNSVLLNYYRNQHDSVAWHSDSDRIPGRQLAVASVSFGQARCFDLRRKDNHASKFSVLLEEGSYLLMKGEFQERWEHRIAKSSAIMAPRINLTFRISERL